MDQIGAACKKSGFFQLVNHGIPESLQRELLSCSEEFFSLPLEVKETYNKGNAYHFEASTAMVLTRFQISVATIAVTKGFVLKTLKNALKGI